MDPASVVSRSRWAYGSRIYVANYADGTVSIIDTAPGRATYRQVIATVPVGDTPSELAVTARNVYVVGVVDDSFTSVLAVIDTTNNTVTNYPHIASGIAEIAIDYAGSVTSHIYVLSDDGDKVGVFNEVPQGTGAPLVTYEQLPIGGDGRQPRGIAVSPNGHRVYASSTLDNSVSVIDTNPASATDNTVIAVIPVGDGPNGMEVSPDGTHLYVTNSSGASVSVVGWHRTFLGLDR